MTTTITCDSKYIVGKKGTGPSNKVIKDTRKVLSKVADKRMNQEKEEYSLRVV